MFHHLSPPYLRNLNCLTHLQKISYPLSNGIATGYSDKMYYYLRLGVYSYIKWFCGLQVYLFHSYQLAIITMVLCHNSKNLATIVWEKFGMKKFLSEARYDEN